MTNSLRLRASGSKNSGQDMSGSGSLFAQNKLLENKPKGGKIRRPQGGNFQRSLTTGKNVLAKAIHEHSKWKSGPFVPVNCLAIPDTLIESELFGHEKGAFTDAHALRKGSFEAAHCGTLFLDEIGDMSALAQGKILQAIEDSVYRRVGGEKMLFFNARIIASTNRDLLERIEAGVFRGDLFYRLNEVCLHLPPLRERKEDIPRLLRHFIHYYCQVYARQKLDISKTALNYLTQYHWPGNIRELKNVVKSAVILCSRDMLWLEDFPFQMSLKTRGNGHASDDDYSLDSALKQHITRTLKVQRWNKKRAAKQLGVSRPRLDRYIKKLGLEHGSNGASNNGHAQKQ